MDIYYQPYTYLIGWSKLNKWYYGVEYKNSKNKIANPKNLWNTYFTSSNHVKNFREINGDPDIIKVHKTFISENEAVNYEHELLTYFNVKENDYWLNQANGNVLRHISTGKTWWNNYTKEIRSKESPGNNWIPGRLPMREEIKYKYSHPGCRSKEQLEKQSKRNKNSYWITDGVNEKLYQKNLPIPDGYKLGRALRINVDYSYTKIKKHRYNNGKIESMIYLNQEIPQGLFAEDLLNKP